MVLPQDQAQASQASNILAEREYRAKLAQYEQDKKKYEKELDDYNKEVARLKKVEADKKAAEERARQAQIKAAQEAQAKRDAEWNRIRSRVEWETRYLSGGAKNRAMAEAKFKFEGGSDQAWRDLRAQENRDRANSQRQSASLRAAGNAQIRASQQAELKRLGGSGSLQSGSHGATSVSANISQNRVPVAAGVAAIAQPWEALYVPKAPTEPTKNDPVSNWKQVADPTATGFRDVEKPTQPIPYAPQKVHARNQIAPVLIPAAQRSNVGYAPDGSPYQGASNKGVKYKVGDRTFNTLEHAEKFVQRTGKNVITPIGISGLVNAVNPPSQIAWEVQTPNGKKTFATEQEANQFIQNEERKKPFTDAKILPLESLYRWVNKGAEANQKLTQEKPNDFIAATMAGGSAIQAGLLNAATVGGRLIDKHILKQPTKDTRLVATPTTYYDKGFDATFEGALTSQAPFIHTEKISIQRGLKAAKEQWNKQTPAQNIGQSLAIAPVVVFDAVTLGQGGLAVGRAIARPLGKLTQKVASPTLVNKVVNAPTNFGSKPEIVKKPLIIQPRKPYQVSGEELANQFRTQERISGTTKLTPNKNVRTDPSFTTPTRASEVQQSTGVIPKENIVGEIKLSRGFVPNKPERPFQPKTNKPVQEDPFYSPARRANEIDFSDSVQIGFKRDTISIRGIGQTKRPKSSPDYTRTKEFADFQRRVDPNTFTSQRISFTGTARLPKKTRTPNYITASSDFVDFQKSLVRKPTKYSNIVGEIKLSKGFIPNKYPSRVRRNFPKGEKPVQEDPFFKNQIPMSRLGGNKPTTKKIKRKSDIDKLLKDDDAIEKTFTEQRVELGKGLGSNKIVSKKSFERSNIMSTRSIGFINKKDVIGIKKSNIKKPTRRWDDDKTIEKKIDGDQIGNNGTVLIMKPEIKKATVQSKRLLQKRNNPTPIARDFTRPDSDRVVQVRSSSRQPILLLRPVQQKKKKPLQSTRTRQSQVYATESIEGVRVGSKSKLGLSTGITAKEKLKERESYKVAPILSTRVNVVLAQPQKSKQKTRPVQVLKTPEPAKARPTQKSKPIFRTRAPTRQVQRTTSPIPRKLKAIAALPSDKKDGKKRRRKDDEKTNNFLGNTRLGNIEGLFRRSEVIHGDRRINRQIRKDNKAKFGEGKVRIF